MKTSIIAVVVLLLLSCNNTQQVETSTQDWKTVFTSIEQDTPPEKFTRDSILQRLKKKVDHQEPLFVHIFVPLCDNENQGIVPVSKSLGDGTNLRTNLYWGARYGLKTFFKLEKNWKLIHQQKDLNSNVLERVVFQRKYNSKTTVYLTVDAYRGDRMKSCLEDFNQSISGYVSNYIEIEGHKVGINNNADLIGFNGHNGLMDTSITPLQNKSSNEKDAIFIACISNDYFLEHFLLAKAYPLLLTTNLLAPEAYVISNIIDSWANLESGIQIRLSAAKGYHQYQKCGLRGARRLFQTGWEVNE
jgi:hypothetical protein